MTAQASRRPHIVVIVADDLGWGDVSFHGSRQIPTPNIDTLAGDGLALHHYYVQSSGAATRSALMTGLYPIHTGMQNDDIGNSEPWGLPLKFKILPEHFNDLGYSTYAIGKWHLGYFRKEYTPLMRGFDHHFGFWTSHAGYFDHCSHEKYTLNGKVFSTWGLDFREDLRVASNSAGQYSTNLFTDKAVSIINAHNASKPLLLYLAHQAVHVGNAYHPLEAPSSYVKKFRYIKDLRRRIFAGMVAALDQSVGDVFRALQRKGIVEDTIVLLTSDSGGAAGGVEQGVGSNWPLRGTKKTLWEGGVRAVGLLWSAKLPKGRVASQLIHVTDWLPTLYSAAGGDITDLGSIDGKDLWTVLVDDRPSPRTELLYNIDYRWKLAAIRVGPYKLVLGASSSDQFDDWYEPIESDATNPYLESAALRKALFTDCAVHKALWAIGRSAKVGWADDVLQVECGTKPNNANATCRPRLKPCLFNVEQDPCEYRNVASTERKLLAKLFYRLQEFQLTNKPPLNRPPSPAANPALHCNVWVPFMDSEVTGLRKK
ncbi:arylsulfatase B-like [Ixodes scapularis]|uniref:arylsulfatase B-like n=1 Tax=Ixodes scapularis TaxID=6945 RepID=UPI001A9F7ED1|nr:arylsulfatase B-like [Ixodes scapularis]